MKEVDEMSLQKCCPDCDWHDKSCVTCEGTGYLQFSDDHMVYVNVYAVERCYGGPEEGGWWYDWYDCIETYPCRNKNADTVQEQLEIGYDHIKEGDISSVLGGTDLRVWIEEKPAESQTKERPYYE
jgi:hypothetical protein